MIRSFLAIELPDTFYGEIERVCGELKKSGAAVKWARPQSVHLTLKFLGNVDEGLVEPLATAVGDAVGGYGDISLTSRGLGVFPSPRKPRIVWVGLAGDLEGLAGLQKLIEAAVARFGFEPENRAFRPHLTIGRVKSGKGRAELMAEIDRVEPLELSFTARDVVLFKSDLKPGGAVYTILHRLPLGGKTVEEEL